jgi:hypothetical protein
VLHRADAHLPVPRRRQRVVIPDEVPALVQRVAEVVRSSIGYVATVGEHVEAVRLEDELVLGTQGSEGRGRGRGGGLGMGTEGGRGGAVGFVCVCIGTGVANADVNVFGVHVGVSVGLSEGGDIPGRRGRARPELAYVRAAAVVSVGAVIGSVGVGGVGDLRRGGL